MLTVDNAYSFLHARGLLDRTAVLDGDLEITSSTRRNRNLTVKSESGTSYIIKQPEPDAADAQNTLRREIGFYSFCSKKAAAEPVRALLPRLAYTDSDTALLVLDLVPRSTQLWRHYETSGPERFPVAAAREVGAALGAIHRTFAEPELLRDIGSAGLSADPPTPLSLAHPTPDVRSFISPAALEIIQRVQREDGLLARLDAIAARWRATTVVHGDIKLDNILVQHAAPEDGDASAMRVYLVDWELVQKGDPAWDVAGALRDFIFFWVIFMNPELEPDEMAAQARFPLTVLQGAIRELWAGYGAANSVADEDLLARAVDYAAVRMIRTALDLSSTFPAVLAPAELLLRVASNLLADPMNGRVELFGLDAPEAAA